MKWYKKATTHLLNQNKYIFDMQFITENEEDEDEEKVEEGLSAPDNPLYKKWHESQISYLSTENICAKMEFGELQLKY